MADKRPPSGRPGGGELAWTWAKGREPRRRPACRGLASSSTSMPSSSRACVRMGSRLVKAIATCDSVQDYMNCFEGTEPRACVQMGSRFEDAIATCGRDQDWGLASGETRAYVRMGSRFVAAVATWGQVIGI